MKATSKDAIRLQRMAAEKELHLRQQSREQTPGGRREQDQHVKVVGQPDMSSSAAA